MRESRDILINLQIKFVVNLDGRQLLNRLETNFTELENAAKEIDEYDQQENMQYRMSQG